MQNPLPKRRAHSRNYRIRLGRANRKLPGFQTSGGRPSWGRQQKGVSGISDPVPDFSLPGTPIVPSTVLMYGVWPGCDRRRKQADLYKSWFQAMY